MASTGSVNDRTAGPGGWEGTATVPSLHGGLSHDHNGRGEGQHPMGGSLSTPHLGAPPPPGFNSGNSDARANSIWSSKDASNNSSNSNNNNNNKRSFHKAPPRYSS
mmetsp:Transcript_14799/g.35788  ORF Transcript_14799/g.35788 Transcript_14799/m.35788 type:complete len:106 (+) Transcript_14799:159-476(+)